LLLDATEVLPDFLSRMNPIIFTPLIQVDFVWIRSVDWLLAKNKRNKLKAMSIFVSYCQKQKQANLGSTRMYLCSLKLS